ncbi:MAG: YdcF family protein [Patescibacteria group bacterium]
MNSAKYDAIIVLGGSLTSDGYISDADKTRLQKVTELYKEGIANAIIVCGSNGYKGLDEVNTTEAEAYAYYLQSFNIEPNSIYLEKESKETLGNILFAKMQILTTHSWQKLLVIPTYKHSNERIEYLLNKILGPTYDWEILRVGQNDDSANGEREALALKLSKDINDTFADGDTKAIYDELMKTHPAYGGTKWTLDELREKMK